MSARQLDRTSVDSRGKSIRWTRPAGTGEWPGEGVSSSGTPPPTIALIAVPIQTHVSASPDVHVSFTVFHLHPRRVRVFTYASSRARTLQIKQANVFHRSAFSSRG